MANLAQVLQELREERNRLQNELRRVDSAITAVAKVAGTSSGGRTGGARKRRTVSAATKRKIAAAQRARWARVKKEKGS